jgi:hypothetical protein
MDCQSRIHLEPSCGRCYNCNEPGHYSGVYPSRQVGFVPTTSHTADQTGEQGYNNRTISRRLRSAHTAYVPAILAGNHGLCWTLAAR